MLRVISNRVPKLTTAVRSGDKPCFKDRYVLAHRAKQSAYSVSSSSKTQIDWKEYRGTRRYAQLNDEHSLKGANTLDESTKSTEVIVYSR